MKINIFMQMGSEEYVYKLMNIFLWKYSRYRIKVNLDGTRFELRIKLEMLW